jgi:hypothetical protein
MRMKGFLMLVGLIFFVAHGNRAQALTVRLTASTSNPAINSSVTLTAVATSDSHIESLELLEIDATGATKVLKSVTGAVIEDAVSMNVSGRRSFIARVTNTLRVVVNSVVVELNTSETAVGLNASRREIVSDGSSPLTASIVASGDIHKVEYFERRNKDALPASGFDTDAPSPPFPRASSRHATIACTPVMLGLRLRPIPRVPRHMSHRPEMPISTASV